MNRRKELIEQYKEIKIEAGVYQIRNLVNGKILIESSSNLKSLNGRKIELQLGTSRHRTLQADWTAQGEDAFVFEVLEVLKPNDNPFVSVKDELKVLLEQWIEKLQPFDERGYNSPPKK
ncbi:MAG: GIY-YIG nuclease family protein [Candidatus Cohnella colombiensis]|uniref:GIY-YIG nuclease family protein n=1 Tax=Candidatus Cohnella colombiensis TaxID=3121368 RepID=A0AA95F7A5_9BACL|nr:MAG: GIY-YIG nuclease family protein [Cohnella sp.]